jgi:hypothetical protein
VAGVVVFLDYDEEVLRQVAAIPCVLGDRPEPSC